MHAEECLRSTNSGKLLLLAHPDARLIVRGLEEHDIEYERLIHRPSTVVLYPSERAHSTTQLKHLIAERAARRDSARTTVVAGGGADGEPRIESLGEGSLDILLLDGTWSQARLLARQLPPAVTMVALESVTSTFGKLVRDQSSQRTESARVCTLEAYAQLAAELGDAPAAVEALHRYLARMIDALETVKPSIRAAREAGVGSQSEA